MFVFLNVFCVVCLNPNASICRKILGKPQLLKMVGLLQFPNVV